ncbi:MAG: cupin domain-containing protein [Rhodospirillales bacterium]
MRRASSATGRAAGFRRAQSRWARNSWCCKELADDQGQYPAGTYVRDPLGATRASWTEEGCVLFVKLRQMHPDDRERVVVDTPSAEWFPGLTRGIAVLPLYAFGQRARLAGALGPKHPLHAACPPGWRGDLRARRRS